MTSSIAARNEVGSQRVASALGPEWSFSRGRNSSPTSRLVRIRHVSNSPFPNPPGPFQGNGLSGEMTPPVSGFCGLHRTLWVLFIFPCPPSPCPGHYPRHLSTTRTLSPCGSRRVGDPEVSRSTCVVVRYLHSPDSPHHLRVATAGGLLRQRACLTQTAVYVL
jgi:hypothetical protein